MPLEPNPWIVSCGGEQIRLWDLGKNFWAPGADGCHAATVSYSPVPGSAVLCTRWNHTNYVVASAGEDPRIEMWTAQGQRLGSIPDGTAENAEDRINTLCFSRRSRLLITAGSSHVIRVWDMKRRVCTQTLSGHASSVTCVSVNPKDEQLASVSEKGTLCLHNLNSGTRVAQLKDPDGQALQVVEYSPHAKHLLATAGDGGAVHLWNATSRKIERSWKKAHSAPVMGLAFSPTDPKVLVTVGLDKRLLVFDPTSSSPPVRVSAEVPLSCVHFKDDGTTLAVGTSDGRIFFYDVRARAWKTHLTLQAFKKSVQVACVQWQSFLHSDPEEHDFEPPARPVQVNFQPEVDLKTVPPNLRGSDKVIASLGSALFTPKDGKRDFSGANGGPHTPVRIGDGAKLEAGAPSEMDVFSPLVEVQPITPYVPKHWNGMASDRFGVNSRGDGLGSRLPGSRLSFTEIANHSGDSLPGENHPGEISPGGRSGGSSPGGRPNGTENRAGQQPTGPRPAFSDLESRLGEIPRAQFSSVSDLRQEAKRKLQASISAKAGGGVKPPGDTNRGDEPRLPGSSFPSGSRPTSSGSSRSGPVEREPRLDPLYDPTLNHTRNPSFDQLPSSASLPPRYSNPPPSETHPPVSKPGTFTSTMFASSRLLAESSRPSFSGNSHPSPRHETHSLGSPVAASRPLLRQDVTPPTFGSPVPSYDSAAPPVERDTLSPDWLTSRIGPQASTAQNSQMSEEGHVAKPLVISHSGGASIPGSSALESSSGVQGFDQASRPDSIEPPPASEARGAFPDQVPNDRGAFSHQSQSAYSRPSQSERDASQPGQSGAGAFSHRVSGGNSSPGSRRASEGGFGTGIGRRQEFGQGKDVRWHENAIVGVDADSRPPSEPQTVAPTPHSQPFSLQLVQRALEDSLGPLQRSFHQEIQNLHLEVLRQFHMQQGETQALVASILERQAALEEEVKALRKENQQLRHLF